MQPASCKGITIHVTTVFSLNISYFAFTLPMMIFRLEDNKQFTKPASTLPRAVSDTLKVCVLVIVARSPLEYLINANQKLGT